MLKRSRLFALAALLVVGLLAGCGDDDTSGGGSDGKTEDPVALLKKALSAHVESGELKAEGKADFQGSTRMSGPVSFSLEGPFQSRGKTKLPLVDWDVSVSGAGQDFSGGIVATEDNAFLKFRGQTYEVGTELYQQFIRQQQKQNAGGPQSLKDLGIDPSAWLDDPEVGEGEPIGGSPTRKVSGDVDVRKMAADLVGALKSPAFRKQLEGTGRDVPEISDSDIDMFAETVQSAKLTVNVDDDDVARKVAFTVAFEVPEGADANGVTGGRIDLSYELPKVGGDVDITAPADAKPLALLLQQLGLGAGLPGGGLRTQ